MVKIRDLENKKSEDQISFKEFYKYFKKYDYNLGLKRIIYMYKVYVS